VPPLDEDVEVDELEVDVEVDDVEVDVDDVEVDVEVDEVDEVVEVAAPPPAPAGVLDPHATPRTAATATDRDDHTSFRCINRI
jgi:hypothetical protein